MNFNELNLLRYSKNAVSLVWQRRIDIPPIPGNQKPPDYDLRPGPTVDLCRAFASRLRTKQGHLGLTGSRLLITIAIRYRIPPFFRALQRRRRCPSMRRR